jgi:hypothetical protein
MDLYNTIFTKFHGQIQKLFFWKIWSNQKISLFYESVRDEILLKPTVFSFKESVLTKFHLIQPRKLMKSFDLTEFRS